MKDDFLITEFFLGANTPTGFFSLFDNLCQLENDCFCHILKGGPGTGKSTLMKKMAKKSKERRIPFEIIRCPSDPKSFDAIIIKDLKECFVDGTAPHTIDPKYPGISDEIINLGQHWNIKKLQKSKNKIIRLCEENANLHKISKRYLTSLSYAYNSNLHITKEITNYKKLDLFCENFANKNIKNKKNEKSNEKLRFISSVTPDGYIFLEKSISSLCKKVFVIEDNYNFLGDYILKFLRSYALNLNQNIITCPSPFAPLEQIEAIFITDLKILFIVNNQFYNFSLDKYKEIEIKKISTKRFLEKEKFNSIKNILNFNNKVCKEFIKESVYSLSKARKVHDEIEYIYSSAMNYDEINKITQELLSFR